MSDTPRTDAALSKVGYCTEDACQDWTPLLELCRSLERELALAVDNAVAQMEKAGERSFPPEVTYREIGSLHRTRDGQVHFVQKENRMEFALHSFITIYAKDGSDAAEEQS